MKKIIYITLLLIFISPINAKSQNDLKYATGVSHIKGNNDFLISTRPITNREYLIFLLWNFSVYIDYPEVLSNFFPGIKRSENTGIGAEIEFEKTFDYFIKHSFPYVKNYIFNPRYIDYPVIGITRYQASQFCKWLSDRYNEFKLIENNYLALNPIQVGDNSFSTEAFLCDQYLGLRKSEKTIKWNDKFLVPSFRLPVKQELIDSKKIISDVAVFKSYAFDTSSFLKYWDKWFLVVNDSVLVLKNLDNYEESFKNTIEWRFDDNKFKELTLDYDIESNNLSVIDIFNKLGQAQLEYSVMASIEKDSLGHMPFIIIENGKRNEPVIVSKYKINKSDTINNTEFYYFRYVCKMNPGKYVNK